MPAPKTAPLWSGAFVRVTAGNFLLFTAFQFLLPTIPLYAADLGAAETAIGLIVGTMTAFAVLIRPFAGAALDRYGRRGPLFAGLLLHGLAMGLYALPFGLAGLVVARIVHGLGWGMATTAFGTLAADLVPAERRGEGIGYFGLSSALGMAVGPAIGNRLYAFGPAAVFGVAFAFTAFALLLMVPPLPAPAGDLPPPDRTDTADHKTVPPAAASRAGRSAPRLIPALRDLVEPAAAWPAALAMLMTLTYGGIVTFLPLFGREAGIAGAGLFFSANAVMTLLVRLVAGRLFDRSGYVVIAGAAVFGGIGLLLIAGARTLGDLLVAALFYGVAFGVIQPALQAWAVSLAAPERRGAANAMYFSAFDLGIGGGAILLGPVATAVGFRPMYRGLAALFALFILLGGLAPKPRRRPARLRPPA
ncbi:MFS transporter [Hydrogenibacillus schlegelii]|uniref:MFS transporter n=1 Tax=Hydrogenibacillus schlegelii TaxID=1484 RepID=A0A179IQF6_HYDSH|nr:MFS transporter [Hydrogenibacillus schlegelii]MBT9282887.1 MFS transporter [Hydrogenibacillus schlegelii]OAR04917.1 hypothetical protein SA87_04340 [Hydrogenibacillus schlegelii]